MAPHFVRRPIRAWRLAFAGMLLGLFAFGAVQLRSSQTATVVHANEPPAVAPAAGSMVVGSSYHNDTSPALRDLPPQPIQFGAEKLRHDNVRLPLLHKDAPDPVVQRTFAPAAMPLPMLNFDGIGFPGVGCNCSPPDTNGEVGATQYVQMVNEGYQVFNKITGASVLGPAAITSLWTGFGGACQTGGFGDPVVLYDQLANRWVITEFASATGGFPITDECVVVSQSSDATGAYNRYGFHLGSNFYDYPHLAVWPDAYYMSVNVLSAAGTTYLGPQPFALDRTQMLLGQAATFQSTVAPLGDTVDRMLPADLDGAILPVAGAAETFLGFPGGGSMPLYHFHVDWVTPANSTFTTFANPPAAPFTLLCPGSRTCVPQAGTARLLDGISDRMMFRLAYRRFTDGHEALIGNYSVNAGGVAGIRWFELRNPTAGPVTVFQESTYQPDTTWRWLGSAAMDAGGDLAIGFNAASATINPQIRYAGRLVTDPINTLGQGEAHLIDGSGSQISTNRWGDYSDLTVDPTDDCTFYYTAEYSTVTSGVNWRTRIGSFRFPSCGAITPTATAVANTATRTATSNSPTTTQTAEANTATRTVTTTQTATATSAMHTATTTAIATSATTTTSTPIMTTVAQTATANPATATFMPPTNTATPSATATVCTIQFSDVQDATAYYYQGVYYLACRGVISGYADGTYKPFMDTTRGQMTKIVILAFNVPLVTPPATGTFADVDSSNVFYQLIETAARGIVSGYTCGGVNPQTGTAEPCTAGNRPYFRPSNFVTRSQLAKIVVLGAGWALVTPPTPTFNDVATDNVFYSAIETAACRGSISGYSDGTFRPNTYAFRGQIAKIVYLAAGNATACRP